MILVAFDTALGEVYQAWRGPCSGRASAGRLAGVTGRENQVQETDGVGQVKVTFTGSRAP